jgi:hypothetical protein
VKWRKDGVACPPKRLAHFGLPRPVQLRVADQLGDEAINRERRPIQLEEALLDRDLPKIASACAGLAAGVCIAAGAVPGVGGIGVLGHQSHAKEPSARSVPYLAPSSEQRALIDILPRSHALSSGQARNPPTYERAQKAALQTTEPSTAQPASPVSNSPADARVSGRQTGTEVGAESGGRPLPGNPPPVSPSSPGSSNSGRAVTQSGQSFSSENGGGSRPEFGM